MDRFYLLAISGCLLLIMSGCSPSYISKSCIKLSKSTILTDNYGYKIMLEKCGSDSLELKDNEGMYLYARTKYIILESEVFMNDRIKEIDLYQRRVREQKKVLSDIVNILKITSNSGHLDSQYFLANIYNNDHKYTSMEEVVVDFFDQCKANTLYEKLSEKKDRLALSKIGDAYNHGYCKEKDEIKALYYYVMAAKLGDSSSIYQIAFHYSFYNYVDRDGNKLNLDPLGYAWINYLQNQNNKKNGKNPSHVADYVGFYLKQRGHYGLSQPDILLQKRSSPLLKSIEAWKINEYGVPLNWKPSLL